VNYVTKYMMMENGFKKSKNLVWSIALRIYHFKHSLFFE